MASWFIKVGRQKSKDYQKYIESETPIIMIGFDIYEDVNNFREIDKIKEFYAKNEFSHLNNYSKSRRISQIHKFVSKIKIEDNFFTETDKGIMFAEIISDCRNFEQKNQNENSHQGNFYREVRVIASGISNREFDKDFLRSMRTPATLCKAKDKFEQYFLNFSANIVAAKEIENILEDENSGYYEGKEKQEVANHVWRERNYRVVIEKKLRAPKPLKCEACEFCFVEFYGKVGDGFMECHHLEPIGSRKSESETKPEDVVLLCSNCHRMIHRLMSKRAELVSIEEFRLNCLNLTGHN
jgi:predicted HNH restriction endonuclease